MKYFLIYWFIFFSSLGFSQDSEPETYSKIHFVYNKKSNYHIDENGVFADTLLLKLDFPKIRYSLRTEPLDKKSIIGFVRLEDFDKESRKKLVDIIYHSVEKIEGTYDKKKNRTKLKISRNDNDVRQLFKNLFKESYYRFDYIVLIDYDAKTVS